MQKIFEYIDSGNVELASKELQIIKENNLTPDLLEKLSLYEVLYRLENRQPDIAKSLLEPYILNLDKYSNLRRLEILNLDVKIKIHQSEFMKADVSMEKLNDLIKNLSESDRRNIDYIIADLQNYQGLISASKGDYHSAMAEFEKATMAFRKQDRYRQRAQAMFNHGKILSMLGQLEKATAILDETSLIFKEIELNESLALTYDLLIQIHEAKSDRDSVYTYKQLKQNLKEKIEFDTFKHKAIRERDILNDELSKSNLRISQLQEQIFGMKFTLDSETSLGLESNSLADEVDRQKVEAYDKLEKHNNQLEDIAKSQAYKIEELESELKGYRKEIGKIVETRQKLAQEKVKVEMLTADVEDLTNELEKLKSETDTQEAIESATQKIVNLQNSLSSSNMEKGELMKQVKRLENQLKDLEVHETADINSTTDTDKIKDLMNAIVEKDDELDKLKSKMSKLINEESNRVQVLKDEIKVLKEKEDKIVSKVDLSSIEELEIQISKSDVEISNLKSENQELVLRITELEKLTKKPIQKVPIPVETEPNVNKELQLRVKKLEAENIGLKDEIAILKEKLVQNQIETSYSEIERVESLSSDINDKTINLVQLLASDKLVETVYSRLRSLQTVNLRILAMQSGISPQKCLEAIEQLEKVGALTFDQESNIVKLS